MTLHAGGNLIEAILWLGIAAGVFVRQGRRGLVAGLALAAFGVSDLVEIQTGHWARPWWLLAWKAACIAVLLPIAFKALRTARSTRPGQPPAA